MQEKIRRQIYLVLLVTTVIANHIFAATTSPIVLQVDQVLKSKLNADQEQQIEKAQKKVADAKTEGDVKLLEAAEKNLASKIKSIDSSRKVIIVGRMQVVSRGLNLPDTQDQEPCALLVGTSDKKIALLRADEFIEITRIVAGKGDQPGRGPRDELQALVSENILNPFTNAFVVSGWKKTSRPKNWPIAACETPWLLPSDVLTKQASLVVELDKKKWEYQFQDSVRFMLHIKNGGTDTIVSASICFVFLNSENKPILTQHDWTDSSGNHIARPLLVNLKPGDTQTIETYATKSISAQMSTISVAVTHLEFANAK